MTQLSAWRLIHGRALAAAAICRGTKKNDADFRRAIYRQNEQIAHCFCCIPFKEWDVLAPVTSAQGGLIPLEDGLRADPPSIFAEPDQVGEAFKQLASAADVKAAQLEVKGREAAK